MVGENSLVGEDVAGNLFPVGMRVLAVDDDQTCLKMLENLLRKCQYHVTTTTQSIKALELLRKNRNMFDLVISFKMPGIDGFKLLEQVGHMDLPVIMLSGYGDKELVMKGVIQGACDYLIKPVRIEELRNIWQHVMRKKMECKDQNKASNEENKNIGLKNKAQSEEKEEDYGETGQENQESSTQKKPRLVWSTELHKKFVAAVSQLGLDKAYPKRILELMNVEGITRENVASHLQKFRLNLKKPTQQADMVAALGSSDPHQHMGSVDGYEDFCTPSGSTTIIRCTLPSYHASGLISHKLMKSPSCLNLRGISSSALVQPNQSGSIKTLGNIPLSNFPNQFQQNNCSVGIANSSGSSIVPKLPNFPNQFQQNNCPVGIANSSGSSIVPKLPNFPNLFQQNNCPVGIANSSGSSIVPKLPNFPNQFQQNNYPVGIANSSGSSIVPKLPNFPNSSTPLSEVLNNSYIGKSPIDFSSTSSVAVPLKDARGELQYQEGLLGNICILPGMKPQEEFIQEDQFIQDSWSFDDIMNELEKQDQMGRY